MRIKTLKLSKFRGVQNLTLNDLSTVNVIVGCNNSGKTSILEAISIMGDAQNWGRVLQVAFQRAQRGTTKRVDYLSSYVASVISPEGVDLHVTTESSHVEFRASGKHSTSIDSQGMEHGAYVVDAEYVEGQGPSKWKTYSFIDGCVSSYAPVNPVYTSTYLHSTVSYYRTCVNLMLTCLQLGGKQEMLQVVQMFDRSIRDITLVGTEIYLENTEGKTLPLYNYGAGLQKAACFAAVLIYARDSVVLIDEIETAVHSSACKELLSWFFQACVRLNIQAFVTTHNAETLDALITASQVDCSIDDALRVITLHKGVKSGDTIPTVRSGKEAFQAREDWGMELRE